MAFASVERLKTAAEKNPLVVKEAKEKGKKIVGLYCLYSPAEIALAAGAAPMVLCGTRNDPIATAEETLPRNLCPLIKSSYGFAVQGTCPYFSASDIIVADTTCDGKKKMFEYMSEIKPLHLLYLPHGPHLPEARVFWAAEMRRLVERLEKEFGVSIGDDDLVKAIGLANRERAALKGLMDLSRQKPAPLSGMTMLELLFKSGFFADKEEIIGMLEEIVAEVSAASQNGASEGPRVLLTGVPVGMGSHKVVKLIEDAGARVVAFENCTGYKKTLPVATDKPPLEALAERYLATPCSIMSPNTARFDLLDEMIRDFSADAVVDLTWQACHTYNVEAGKVRRFVQDKGLPYLQIETDYSEADTEQLKVRIEAFLEMMH